MKFEDLIVGNVYYFVEASTQKTKDLNVFRARLTSKSDEPRLNSYDGKYHLAIAFEAEDMPELRFFTTLILKDGEADLSAPLTFLNDSTSPEGRLNFENTFGVLTRNPRMYTIGPGDDIEECLESYGKFLEQSIDAYKKRIEDMHKDLAAKCRTYGKQLDWLLGKYGNASRQ